MKFSGFLNVYRLDDMSWKYVYGDKTHLASNLRELEFLVRMHGLKWAVLDEELARKSIDEDRANFTGFFNVYHRGDLWYYRGSDLKSHSLEVLKRKVIENNLEWRETDSELAYKNWKLDSRKFRR